MIDKYIRIVIAVAALTFVAVCSARQVAAFPHKILSIESPKEHDKGKASPLQLQLQEVENGLKASIRFAETKADAQEKKPPELPADLIGGDYLLFLDEMIVRNETYKGTSLNVVHDVPLTTMQTGKHVLRCELRAPSGEIHKSEIRFVFDGSPALSVTDVAVDKTGILDASVILHILGDDGNGLAGFVHVFLDERPLMNVQIAKEHIGKKTLLSKIIGKPLSTASLVPGTHLLTLQVMGTNGNAAVNYSSFAVSATPELKIVRDKNGEFQEAMATFLKSPEGFSGSIEVFSDQGILLTKRDEGVAVSIKRTEIIEKLEKSSGRELLAGPLSLVFSLRSANGSETWQMVGFK